MGTVWPGGSAAGAVEPSQSDVGVELRKDTPWEPRASSALGSCWVAIVSERSVTAGAAPISILNARDAPVPGVIPIAQTCLLCLHSAQCLLHLASLATPLCLGVPSD